MDDRCHRQTLHVLLAFMVLAILTNGLYFWLLKSQVLPSNDQIAEIIAADTFRDHEDSKSYASRARFALEPFYRVPPEWIFTKALKDIFAVSFLAISLLLWKRPTVPISPSLVALAACGLIITLACVNSLRLFGPGVAAMGLRPFVYVLAGLVGMWASGERSLALVCRYLVAVLVIELGLGLYEQAFGLHLFQTGRLGNRVGGTFSFPGSLGVFAVIAGVFVFSFSLISRLLVVSLVSLLVYLTGSATALVLLAVAIMLWVGTSVSRKWRQATRLGSLALLAALLLAMPKMVERSDVMDSLWGRIEVAADYLNHLPGTTQVLFGKGLGIGSNIVITAVKRPNALPEPEGVDLYHARADSTPMALINQIGVVGTALFYSLLLAAAWRDRPAMATYLILILAGMAINLLELFPVNFLMGLLLCRSLLGSNRTLRAVCKGTKPAAVREIRDWLKISISLCGLNTR